MKLNISKMYKIQTNILGQKAAIVAISLEKRNRYRLYTIKTLRQFRMHGRGTDTCHDLGLDGSAHLLRQHSRYFLSSKQYRSLSVVKEPPSVYMYTAL